MAGQICTGLYSRYGEVQIDKTRNMTEDGATCKPLGRWKGKGLCYTLAFLGKEGFFFPTKEAAWKDRQHAT